MLATSIDTFAPLLMLDGTTRGLSTLPLATEVLQHHLQRMP